ncbi:MAG: 50S ribosomal protein L22 [Deltaproteobacteria bacterium]
MLAHATLKFARGSGKKYRLVVDLIRGMRAVEAQTQIRFVNKRAAYYVGKVLASAIANAKNKGLDVESLVISRITADDGPRWKRFRASAFGRAGSILKRTSHIRVELDLPAAGVVPKAAPAAPAAAEEKPAEEKKPKLSSKRKPARAKKAGAKK